MFFRINAERGFIGKRVLAGLVLIAAVSCPFALADDALAIRFRQMVKEALTNPAELKQVLLRYPDVIEKVMSEKDLDSVLKEADLVDGEIGSLGNRLSDFRNEALDRQPFWRKWILALHRKLFPQVKINWLKHVKDDDLRALGTQLDGLLSNINLSDSEVMGEIVRFEDGRAKTAVKLITRYFDRLPAEKKKSIVVSLLDLPPKAPMIDKLEAVLQELGPGAQKAIQLVGEESGSEIMRATSKRLLANVKPFKVTDKMKKDLEAAWGKPFDEVFSEFDEAPVKAGTIGQVHRGRLKQTGEIVYTKLRRPNIDENLGADLRLFKDVSEDEPLLRSLVDRMERSLLKEGDFLREAANIGDIQGYARPDRSVGVVQLAPEVPPTADALVMREVKGTPLVDLDLSRLTEQERRQLAQSMKSLMETWFDRAIFSSEGVYHGDPHAGNILVNRSTTAPYFHLGVVDAGNVGRISLKDRRAFVELMLSCLNARRPQDAVEALGQFGRIDVQTRNGLFEKLKPFFADSALPPMGRLQEVMKAALEAGVPLPDEIVGLERARMFLDRMYRQITDGSSSAAERPMAIYGKVASKRVAEGLPRAFFLKEQVVVTPAMVTRYLGRNPQELLRALDMGSQTPGVTMDLADRALSTAAGCLFKVLKGPGGLLPGKQ